MKTKLSLILFIFFSITGVAQERTITGQVTDVNKETLPGVNVIVKGTTLGAVTDVEGRYTISIPSTAQVLVFSFVGFQNKEVQLKGQSVVNVVLKEEGGLSEVVVTALGVQTKTCKVSQVLSRKKVGSTKAKEAKTW
ncbi:carboxypeptidase-like regulatory domain-containing protein, partial [Microscilla marina]|uniref:carboxypeptidase-like regulatory domain-containing protein n=1 Tax=Microscilla marina TaxID=1027 RepID=UPI0005D483D1